MWQREPFEAVERRRPFRRQWSRSILLSARVEGQHPPQRSIFRHPRMRSGRRMCRGSRRGRASRAAKSFSCASPQQHPSFAREGSQTERGPFLVPARLTHFGAIYGMAMHLLCDRADASPFDCLSTSPGPRVLSRSPVFRLIIAAVPAISNSHRADDVGHSRGKALTRKPGRGFVKRDSKRIKDPLGTQACRGPPPNDPVAIRRHQMQLGPRYVVGPGTFVGRRKRARQRRQQRIPPMTATRAHPGNKPQAVRSFGMLRGLAPRALDDRRRPCLERFPTCRALHASAGRDAGRWCEGYSAVRGR